MNHPGVSAIIPTLGRPESLRSCLTCLAAQSVPVDEIIVVHCGDDPDTEQVTSDPLWLTHGLHCRYIHVESCNAASQRDLGIHQARHDHILLLDDDVEVEEHWAVELFRPILASSDVGATMGRILNTPTAEPPLTWRLYRSLFVAPARRAQPGMLVGAALPNGFPSDLTAPTPTEWIGGGVSALTRQAYFSVGGFAPYFAGSSPGEDLDLGYRLSRRWRVLYVPAARCTHHHDSRGREDALRHQYLSLRSRYAIQVAAMGRSGVSAWAQSLAWATFQTASELAQLMRGKLRSDFLAALAGRSRGLASCIGWSPRALAPIEPVKAGHAVRGKNP